MPQPLVLLGLLAFSTAHAGIEILSTHRDAFSPSTPEAGLVAFQVQRQEKRVTFRGDPPDVAQYMTDVAFTLRTSRVNQLRNFGVVQWIRGCQWESQWENGVLTKRLNIRRDHFGESITYQHRDWEIDSDSHDPLYTSFEGDRFALWRWNARPASLEPSTATFLHHRPAPHPRVFVTDMPGAMGQRPASPYLPYRTASNSTVEFRTCLFRMVDVPALTDRRGSNIDERKALHCFTWGSSYVWDFQAGRMTSPAQIDPVCGMEE